ncbi:MAG: multicopper oxidase family protein [Bryobacteraceae bacterium]
MVTRRQFLAACTAMARSARLASAGGLLEIPLEASPTTGRAAARTIEYWGYNGTLPGPLLEVRPGDTVRVSFRNGLPESTNLHFHGLHVSPSGAADNPFLDVPPGEQFLYEFSIPPDHPSGLYWYHPHMHGMAARQVYRGLAGALLVRGDIDAIPEIAAAQEQITILQDFTLDRNNRIPEPSMPERMRGREGSIITLNGEWQPSFSIAHNGLLRLRLVNASCSRHYRIAVEDHPLAVIALDGNSLRAPLFTEDWLLAPGQRADLLLAGNRPAGSYRILNLPYDRGGMGMGFMGGSTAQAPILLATLTYADTAPQSLAIPDTLLPVDPLPSASRLRRFVLSEGGMASFLINGRSFDPDRIDTRVLLGDVEDWEIQNQGDMDHPFHIHTNPFQALDATLQPEPVWRDTIHVPGRSSRRIRIQFRDFPGRTLYHCHILDHEDFGMMGTLDITAAAPPQTASYTAP